MSLHCLGMERGVLNPLLFFRLSRVLGEIMPDVTQAWMYHGNLAASIAALSGKGSIPVIWNVRHSLYDARLEKKQTRMAIRAGRMLAFQPDKIIYNSALAGRQHEGAGFPQSKSVVIPNGVDMNLFRPSEEVKEKICREIGIAEDALVVGHVARFHPMMEPHFWGDFLRNGMKIDEYENLFAGATKEHKAVVDASTSYFYLQGALTQILEYNQDAKFIVMLRNPVDLVYSLHSELLYRGIENISDFTKAWSLQKTRKVGRNIPLSCKQPMQLQYYERALLGNALQNLVEMAGKENVHWIFLDDIKADARRCYTNVLSFLKIDDDGRQDFPVLNRSKRHRFSLLNRFLGTLSIWRARIGLRGMGARTALNRYAKVEAERSQLTAEFRWKLYDSFIDDIFLLQRITGRNLDHWAPDSDKSVKV
ncbi:MAG: glycosyltransferase [Chlorobiales bacterium]|nr:glycosyltransferase [Chlorobiales bacterium]